MPACFYPFGRPVTSRPPSADGPRRAFILGAYPSALHVCWTPPSPYKAVKALAVDDEPDPFWDGHDEPQRVIAWKEATDFDEATMGSVSGCPRLNGPSGKKLRERYFRPFRLDRADCWITDTLDTYRLSDNQAERIEDTYLPVASGIGLPPPFVRPHPSEAQIVAEASAEHLDRLATELETASPSLIITLGNAAQRVMRKLLRPAPGHDPGPAVGRGDDYGRPIELVLAGSKATWLPLAHPAAPAIYQNWHDSWMQTTAATATAW